MACVWVQVAPPSVDTLADTALRPSLPSKDNAEAYAVPSGPNETHGSEERWYGRPPGAQALNGSVTSVQLAPPLVE
jgi:hypothetical protein